MLTCYIYFTLELIWDQNRYNSVEMVSCFQMQQNSVNKLELNY